MGAGFRSVGARGYGHAACPHRSSTDGFGRTRFVARVGLLRRVALWENTSMSEPSPHALRVLVIDDDPEGARSLSELFRCYGCATAVAYSGRVGLRLLKLFKPELVFVDFDMPDMNGLEVVSEAKLIDAEAGRHVMYVCLTGGGPEITDESAGAAGFNRLLYKPLKVTDLLAVLLTARPGNFVAGSSAPAIRPARPAYGNRTPRH
ncbi:response regulator [Mitsuaria sp. TWR114]|nr:response regulator [Mitsuaria sp. TWR114]